MYPILFKIGFITVYTYGFVLAAAFLICTILLSGNFKKKGMKNELAFDLTIYLLIFGIIGARLLHVLLNFNYYAGDLKEIFMLQHGGLAWQGGLFFAFAAGVIFIKKKRLKIPEICDAVIPYVALGQSIGRIGCYLNGCCYGKPTDFFLGMPLPHTRITVHPAQLYLSFFLLMVFIVLRKVEEKKAFDWQVVSLYLVLYSIVRFCVDFFRGDLQAVFFKLTVSQFISMGLLFMGIGLYLNRRPKISISAK